ncbi:hypothetical protein MJ8_29530 [Mesorhizobium sp. J8]|nr:hypothetical protein MJ8_29530 [Mesorhizobium sp. J8]
MRRPSIIRSGTLSICLTILDVWSVAASYAIHQSPRAGRLHSVSVAPSPAAKPHQAACPSAPDPGQVTVAPSSRKKLDEPEDWRDGYAPPNGHSAQVRRDRSSASSSAKRLTFVTGVSVVSGAVTAFAFPSKGMTDAAIAVVAAKAVLRLTCWFMIVFASASIVGAVARPSTVTESGGLGRPEQPAKLRRLSLARCGEVAHM